MTYQSYAESALGLSYGYGLFSNPTPQTANSQIVIGSWTDSIITQAGNALIIPQGYQVQLIASFYTERNTGTIGYNYCSMQWYDQTNATYIGAKATVNSQWSVTNPPNNAANAALAYVDTSSGAITVDCRMLSITASTVVNINGSRFTIYGSQSWLAAITAPV